MSDRRTLLFVLAATGCLVGLAGAVAVYWAWSRQGAAPFGPDTTPEDVQAVLNSCHLVMVGGLLAATAGGALAFFCFRSLRRGMDRMRREMGIGRR